MLNSCDSLSFESKIIAHAISGDGAGTLQINSTVERAVDACSQELYNADFVVVQVGRHKILERKAVKAENRSTRDLLIVLSFEQLRATE